MIIECISCSKKFSLNDALMPDEGSKVRCGSCSEVWFFHPTKESSQTPEENISDDDKVSETAESELSDLKDESTEQSSSGNIEDEKTLETPKKEITNFKIFTEDDNDPPSKEEMDRNLDQYVIDRDNNLGFFAKLFKKDRLKESALSLEKKQKEKSVSEEQASNVARRTRLLFYLLIVLCFAASILLVGIKEGVTMAFPFLEGYLNFIQPMYDYIKGPLMLK